MEALLKAWRTSRAVIATYFEKYDLKQLNHIPEGFNNNLIWNIGHIVVIQQRLAYEGAGLDPHVSTEYFEKYQGGTKPDGKTTQQEVDELKQLLKSLVEQTEADFNNGLLQTRPYKERTTGTGFHLSSIQDALEFNNYHEAMHLGTMMAIRKFV
ncbi:DinB family protein [Reichenbachiella sp.]|uniref:DinB family protein n=1 Tax=Reichenbachiella sp. TaxID=2184521 RepID=UPI003BB1589A